jgi:hypothetical protein
MSKDAIQQAQLEDLAEKTYTMQQYFQEFTDMERGEYDGIHGFHPDQDGNEAYQEGYRNGYEYAQREYAQRIGAEQNG